MIRLVARCGDQVRLFPFPLGEALVGSAADNDIVLPFRGVSRRHARAQPVGRELMLVDLGSKNGVVCAGKRLPQVLLSRGGEIRLGQVLLTLEEISSSDVELALALGEPAGESAASPSTTSVLRLEPPRRSARAALRLIRHLENSGGNLEPGDARLAAARRIIGAETLLVLRESASDVAIVACHGRFPSEALARVLGSADPNGGSVRLDEEGTVKLVLLATRGEPGAPRLAAVFCCERGGRAAWEEDFFAYLAQRLGAAASTPPAPGHAPEPALRLPAEMVMGESPAAAALLADLEAAARGRLNVLLLGETGTGKELLARAIHASGFTTGKPFVAINCAAIPADLLEAELFGVQARVATGVDPRPGLFVQAHGGTVFLDEIGELAEGLQAKLLRVLQEREVLPLGAAAPKKIDVRVVSASNRDLAALTAAGGFRSDLYYRLRGLEIRVPPLRERRDDLPQLAATFASRSAASYGKRILGISRRAFARLLEHPWPGNVRELKDEIERAVLLCPDGGILQSDHFTISGGAASGHGSSTEPEETPPPAPRKLQERIDALEREAILAALATNGGNKTRAAQALGLTRNGLNLKLKRLGLSLPDH